MFESIQALDSSLLLFVQNNIRSDILDRIMVIITKTGDSGAIWLLTAFIFFVSRKYRKAGFDIIVAVAICWGINELLKMVIVRPRPFTEIESLIVLIQHPASWSFPSGHACSSFAAAYAYSRSFKKYGWLTYILAILIALSRVYIGVHYVSDIIAGAVTGTVFAIIVCALSRRFVKIPDYRDMPTMELKLPNLDDPEDGEAPVDASAPAENENAMETETDTAEK